MGCKGMNKEEILDKVDKLIVMYKMGKLGGEVMSEDANKHLEKKGTNTNLSIFMHHFGYGVGMDLRR